MRFQVPQFINIEDKIFGPFTLKQFLYLAGGAGMCYVLFKVLPVIFAIVLALPIGGFALALAFVKINKRPFVFIVQAYVMYLFKSKLYLWNKNVKPQKKEKAPEAPEQEAPRLSESKLRSLAWSLDVLDTEETNSE